MLIALSRAVSRLTKAASAELIRHILVAPVRLRSSLLTRALASLTAILSFEIQVIQLRTCVSLVGDFSIDMTSAGVQVGTAARG